MNLPKTYDASEFEADIYKLWENSGAFQPSGKGEPFSIVLPPPNATGKLHIGHSAMLAIEEKRTLGTGYRPCSYRYQCHHGKALIRGGHRQACDRS